MTAAENIPVWPRLLQAWDQQQSGYLLQREARFAAVLDTITALTPGTTTGEHPLRVLDLGCGPGSFTARTLDRLPEAHVVALDMDPVLLAVGAGALGDADGRLSWVDADLRTSDWHTTLGGDLFDVVVSSTALHWLGPAQLTAAYQRLAQLVRPGGCFFNADNMAYSSGLPTFSRLAASAAAAHSDRTFGTTDTPDWDTWWNSLIQIPELANARKERERRSRERSAVDEDHIPLSGLTSARLQAAALQEAGFTEVDTIWQQHDDRVLLAIR